MKVYFLSDLHLSGGPKALAFCNFLNHLVGGDVLLLGGDIFDLLVGNKRLFRDRFAPIIDAINSAATRGILVHYLEGNHDFHFQGIFSPLVIIHTDDFTLDVFERRIYISHGDLIDPEDRGYRALRAITKNKPFKLFVAAMPDLVVDKIGTHSSGASRRYTTGRVENEGSARLRELYLEFARTKVREGFQHVLIGHSHLRDHVPIEIDGKKGEYINLGFDPDKITYAKLSKNSSAFEISH